LVLNPFECLISTVQENRFFMPSSKAARIIQSISSHMSNINEDFSQTICSPALDLTTNFSFYSSMMIQLSALCWKIDQCPRQCREIIWGQLFVIVGVEKIYDGFITPVLEDTIKNADGVAVLDIEILFISFLLVMRLCPEILELREGIEFLNHKERENILEQNARDFFYFLRKYNNSGGSDVPGRTPTPIFPKCFSLSLLASKSPINGKVLVTEPSNHYIHFQNNQICEIESPEVEVEETNNLMHIIPIPIKSFPNINIRDVKIKTSPSEESSQSSFVINRKSAFSKLKRENSGDNISSSKKHCHENKS